MSSGLEGVSLGQYRLSERLGKGGMAEVYKAYQPSLDRYVAIKILHSYFAEEEDFRNRFQREARAVARLRHPNIVQIYDFGVEGNTYYMAMEFLAGGTLKQRLRSSAELLPHKEVLRIVERVAEALDYAHARGIYHRDVKPANIMLTEDNQVILTDFGLAKMAEGSQYTRSGMSVGTPEYMAPEQGQGLPIDRRADIYSLGVVLYELLTGQLPFTADTPVAIIFKHIKDPLPMPRSLNPDLPENIERVVLKALAKSPDDRYQHAGELAAGLRQAMTDAGEELPTPPPMARAETRAPIQEMPPPAGGPEAPSPPPPSTTELELSLPVSPPPGPPPAEPPPPVGAIGPRVEEGVRRAVSRAAGAEPADDWATIGEKMGGRTRRAAARWVGVEGEEDWDAIGKKMTERIEDKAAEHRARAGDSKGRHEKEERGEKRDEKEEKAEPGWSGRRWFAVGCLMALFLMLCCVCGVCALQNCGRSNPGGPRGAATPFVPPRSVPAERTPPPAELRWVPYEQPQWGLAMRVPSDWKGSPLRGPLGEGVQFVGPDEASAMSYTVYVRGETIVDLNQLLASFRVRAVEEKINVGRFEDGRMTIGGEEAAGGNFAGTNRQTNQSIVGQVWAAGHSQRVYLILAMATEQGWPAAQPLFQQITDSVTFTE